ncbi:MAG: 2-keto-3-deoxy-L-rhamnonate aldolase [Granulosicoccus sp.]|nr:2-keto-3-deoxy-L-rhamnonate aldolase [Granulosicoccus sp.]
MKIASNPFTKALEKKQSQIGLWVSLCDGFAAEVVATAGYDWALLDMEHAPNSIRTVLGQMQAFAPTPTTAIVRPETNDPVLVKRLLDLGADGLLFPMVQSVEEAEKAVSATRYPPRGIRGVSGATRANAFARKTDYFERIEEETTVLLQIETREALDRAEAIAAVDGVSGLFFGPADIAADIGQLGKPMCDEVWELILPVAEKLMALGMPVGTLVQDAVFAAELLNKGFSFVACGSDTGLLARGADNLLSSVKQAL